MSEGHGDGYDRSGCDWTRSQDRAHSLAPHPAQQASTGLATPHFGNQRVTPKRKKRRNKNHTVNHFISNGITNSDVLMGRGGLSNNHVGNKLYLEHKKTLQARYEAALKDDKTAISQELVDWVHSQGGRFLKRDDFTKQWYQVTSHQARTKASQTLREKYTLEELAQKRAYYKGRQARIAGAEKATHQRALFRKADHSESTTAVEGSDSSSPVPDGHLAGGSSANVLVDVEMELDLGVSLESLCDIVVKEPFFENPGSLSCSLCSEICLDTNEAPDKHVAEKASTTNMTSHVEAPSLPVLPSDQSGMTILGSRENPCAGRADGVARSNVGWTPLHIASQTGHVESAVLLVVQQNLADVNAEIDGAEPALVNEPAALLPAAVPVAFDALVPPPPPGARATTANEPDYADNEAMNNVPLTLSVASFPAKTEAVGASEDGDSLASVHDNRLAGRSVALMLGDVGRTELSMAMTECTHTPLHPIGSHGSISTMEHLTATTTTKAPNVAVPSLSLADSEKNDAELVLPSNAGGTSNVGSLEDIANMRLVLNNEPMMLPAAAVLASTEAVVAADNENSSQTFWKTKSTNNPTISRNGYEMYISRTPRVEVECASDINSNQTSMANRCSIESAAVSPTANTRPRALDAKDRMEFPIACHSTDLPTFKDQARDRREETTQSRNQSNRNDDVLVVEATPMPITNAPRADHDVEAGNGTEEDPPTPMPTMPPLTTRIVTISRTPLRNWCHQWGVALMVALVTVLVVVGVVAVRVSNKDAPVPLSSAPNPKAMAQALLPPSGAPAPSAAPSSPAPDATEVRFSFDSTASRATNILNYINSITLSGRRLIPDNAATSPVEDRTLYWIVNVDAFSLVTDTDKNQGRMAQRYALATLWAAGGQWSNQQSALNECEWDGVTCATVSNGLVTEIDLSALDDWNGAGGMSPDLALATSLVHIDLSSKGLTGSLPKSLGRLTNLVSFEVQQNDLTGTLPESIGEWTKLERFSVYDNALTGTIPGSIAQWTKIQSALFDSNKFSGSVPEGICQFRSVDLTLLNADCGAKVACNCCTYCA
jgi:hypothetical protein